MNMSPSISHQMPVQGQLRASATKATGGQLFGDLIAHITAVVTNEQAELVNVETESLAERLAQMSEGELTELIGWLEAEFDLTIETDQQLIDHLNTIRASDLDLDEEDEVVQQLVALLDLPVNEIEPIDPFVWMTNVTPNSNQVLRSAESHEGLDMQAVTESINYLITQLDSLTKEEANQLLNDLKQIQATKQPLSVVLEMLTVDEGDRAKLSVLTKVYDNFDKKVTLAQKTSYQSDTTVTSKDVQKWVQAAVEEINQPTEQSNSNFGELFSQQRTDSPIEQLTIQLGQQVQTTEQMNEQLLTQFEKAISQSRFMQQLSGDKQLLLRLTPESLGTIRVELTEIDGEMLVKLTASSQMAKEALESNMKELRHMFAPQNIAIEKQELEPVFIEQQPPHEEMKDDQDLHDQNQQQGQTEQGKTEDESIHFEDVLYQERV